MRWRLDLGQSGSLARRLAETRFLFFFSGPPFSRPAVYDYLYRIHFSELDSLHFSWLHLP